MMRKVFAAVSALLLAVGVAAADDVKGVFKSFDDKENKVTVEVGGAEKTYKVDPDAKIKRTVGGKTKEFSVVKLLGSKFVEPGKTKLTLTVEGDVVKGVEVQDGKKKK